MSVIYTALVLLCSHNYYLAEGGESGSNDRTLEVFTSRSHIEEWAVCCPEKKLKHNIQKDVTKLYLIKVT